jgi:hypothetical protein
MQFLEDAQNLIGRFKGSQHFRKHVNDRAPLIIAVAAVLLLASAAITVGTVLYLGGKSSVLVLLGMISAPFLLLGSLAVQLYLLFSWLEERALAPVAGRKPKPPPIPVAPAAVFILVPFIGLVLLTWKAALGLILIVGLTIGGYVLLDRLSD